MGSQNLQSPTPKPALWPSPPSKTRGEEFKVEDQLDFTNYLSDESLQDYYSAQTYIDLAADFITDDFFEVSEVQNSGKTQQGASEQDYPPIPKVKLEEPNIDPFIANIKYEGSPTASIGNLAVPNTDPLIANIRYEGSPTAFTENPAIPNIDPLVANIKYEGPPTAFTGNPAIPNISTATIVESNSAIKDVKLQPDTPSSKVPLNSESGLVYPSNPPAEPAEKELRERPRRAQTNPRTMGRNKRHENITTFNAAEHYGPLLETPTTWCSPNGEFQYNKFGELNTRLKLTKEQMLEFLYLHPLHYLDGDYNPRNNALTLWLQTVPADSNRRYPSMGSDKCRFDDCPTKYNTIHKGFFRVAIDEHNRSNIKVDPFHCAGFVHLYCLEKFIDFPLLCKDLNVRPDNRLLVESKNRMAITRDHNELYRIAEDFIKNSKTNETWDYTKTLGYKLTMKHLELEPGSRSRKRKKIGGNHLDYHRGDVEVFAEAEKEKYASRKRRKEGLDEEGNAGDQGSAGDKGDADDQDYNPRPRKRERS